MFNRIMTDLLNTDYGGRRTARIQLAPHSHIRNLAADSRCQSYDSPDWWHLRAAIMKALQDFPEARDCLVRALRELHALQDPHAHS